MSSQNTLTYTITADSAQIERALRNLAGQFQDLNRSANFEGISRSASNATSSLAALAAKATAVVGSIAAVGAAFKTGLGANAELESLGIGLKGIIASLQDVRTATGEPAQGLERLAIAGEEAERQLSLLRLAGMQTSAEFKDLATAFQTALGAGSSAGLSVDQIRDLTVSLTIAAGAFNLAGDQLSSEIRALMSGDQIDNSQIAQGLGISGAQIKLWREQGTLVENLNERLEQFKLLGAESGKSWTATLSNLQDGMTLFLQSTTKDAFETLKTALNDAVGSIIDPETGDIADKFSGLADLAARVFSNMGEAGADAINGLIEGIAHFSEWLDRNRKLVDAIFAGFEAVFDVIGDVVKQTFDFASQLFGAVAPAETLTTIFQNLGVVLAAIFDVGKGFLAVLGMIASFMQLQLLNAVGLIAAAFDKVFRTDTSSFVNNLKKQTMAVGDSAAAMLESAVDFTEARKAFANSQIRQMQVAAPSFSERQRTKRERGDSASGGSVKPPPPPNQKDDKAARQAAKDAEKYAEALAKSLETINAAWRDAAQKSFQAEQELVRAELDKLVALRVLSKRDELSRRQSLEAQALAREKAVFEEAIAAIKERLKAAKDAVEANNITAELIKAQGELDALLTREKTLAVKVELDTAQLEQQIRDMRDSLLGEIERLTGQSALASIERARRTALSNAIVQSDAELQTLTNQKFDLEAQRARFDEAQARFEQVQTSLRLAEQALQAQYERGAITAFELERRLNEARLANVDALREQLEVMREIAELSGDRQLAADVEAASQALDALGDSMKQVARDINRAFADEIGGALKAIVTGSETVADAVRKIFANLFQNLADRFLKQITDQIFTALQSSGSGGVGGLLAGLFGGFRATGGDVSGSKAYVVGEVGPELFFPGASGRVVSNADIQRALMQLYSVPRQPSMPTYRMPQGQEFGGSTTVQNSISPNVVIAPERIIDGLRDTPGFEKLVTDVVVSRWRRIQGAAG